MTDFERTAGASDPADVSRAAQLHEFNTYVTQHLPATRCTSTPATGTSTGSPTARPNAAAGRSSCRTTPAASPCRNPYRLRYVAWQFTDRARVAGFGATVDYNRWLGTPPHDSQEFTMDSAAKARFDAIDARFHGKDGKPWPVENLVLEVVKPMLAELKAELIAEIKAGKS
jgi:hypothetical protein